MLNQSAMRGLATIKILYSSGGVRSRFVGSVKTYHIVQSTIP